MTLSGAMMLFMAVFFFWHTITLTCLIVRYKLSTGERLWLLFGLLGCGIALVLFGAGAVYEIVRLVRVYG